MARVKVFIANTESESKKGAIGTTYINSYARGENISVRSSKIPGGILHDLPDTHFENDFLNESSFAWEFHTLNQIVQNGYTKKVTVSSVGFAALNANVAPGFRSFIKQYAATFDSQGNPLTYLPNKYKDILIIQDSGPNKIVNYKTVLINGQSHHLLKSEWGLLDTLLTPFIV